MHLIIVLLPKLGHFVHNYDDILTNLAHNCWNNFHKLRNKFLLYKIITCICQSQYGMSVISLLFLEKCLIREHALQNPHLWCSEKIAKKHFIFISGSITTRPGELVAPTEVFPKNKIKIICLNIILYVDIHSILNEKQLQFYSTEYVKIRYFVFYL